MKKIIIILLFVFCLFNVVPVFGMENFSQVVSEENTNNIESVLEGQGVDLSFEEVINSVFLGENFLDFGFLFSSLTKLVKEEFFSYFKMLINIVMIALLQGFLGNLSESFKSKSISSLCTYLVYTAFIAIIINSINDAIIIATDYIAFCQDFTLALVPAYVSLLTFTLNITTASIIAPVILFFAKFILQVYASIFINLIYILAVMNLINLLSEKDMLKNFIDLGVKGLKFAIKYSTIGFMAIISLIGIGSPIGTTFFTKTGQYALKSVPVIGNTLGSALDTMLALGDVSKKAFVFAILFISIFILLTYLIRIFIMNFVLYASSFIITTIGEKKIIKALNTSATFFELLISICISSALMFTYSIVILLFV